MRSSSVFPLILYCVLLCSVFSIAHPVEENVKGVGGDSTSYSVVCNAVNVTFLVGLTDAMGIVVGVDSGVAHFIVIGSYEGAVTVEVVDCGVDCDVDVNGLGVTHKWSGFGGISVGDTLSVQTLRSPNPFGTINP